MSRYRPRWPTTRAQIGVAVTALLAGAGTFAGCSVVGAPGIFGRADASDEVPAARADGALELLATEKSCDAGSADCTVVLEQGEVPWEEVAYRLAPGRRWVGRVERVQPCLRADGTVVAERVVAIVVADVTAAEATGNVVVQASVGDVYLSEPDADPSELVDLRPMTSSEGLFDRSGRPLKPLRPSLLLSLLLTPLPTDEVGVGGRWEVQAQDQGLTGVRQFLLVSRAGTEVLVRGLTGDWLDEDHTTQKTTGVTTTRASLDQLGPIERLVELTTPAACFTGTPAAGVRYTVTRQT